MAQHGQAIKIITTKLNRPPVPGDIVCRDQLHSRLDEGRQFPLSLIIAPAGYGKSTVISHWLQTCKVPSTWLSLDEADSDFRVFLSYFVAAVQKVEPASCRNTMVQLRADELPPIVTIADVLCSDLDAIGKDFIMALDDYHLLRNPAIHEFVTGLLGRQLRNMHLAIISRWDPPLPLGRMRGRQMMTEVRLQDLQFGEEETATFLERVVGYPIGVQARRLLHARTEGWPIALRLASLTLKSSSDIERFIHSFGGQSLPIYEYLIAEILSQLPAERRGCLCRLSILDRFCAPLSQALCELNCGEGNCAFHSDSSDRSLLSVGILSIPLDDRQEWFRFHHLFRELLKNDLEKSLGPSGIAELHSRAAGWFEEHMLLEEAIRHSLKGSDANESGRIIARHGTEILNEEQWHRLDQWLSWLPSGAIEDDPELLMLKAWQMQNRGRYAEAIKLLDSVDELLAKNPCDSTIANRLRGEVNALRGYQRYWECDGEKAVHCTEQALASLPPECESQRGYAFIVLAAAHQMTGNLEKARSVTHNALAQDSMLRNPSFRGRLLSCLSFVNWMAADLTDLKMTGSQLIELGNEHGLSESRAMGRYFLGIAEYQRNELPAAEKTLSPVIADVSSPNMEFFAQSAFALCCVYQAQGQPGKAGDLIDSVCHQMLRVGNTTLLQIAQAFQAELALRQGRIAESLAWAEQFNPEPLEPIYRFYSPHITMAKTLILQGSANSLQRAEQLLNRLERLLSKIHNQRFLIDVLALQALYHQTQGGESEALSALKKAVALAQPGGFIRVFTDLGLGVAKLFTSLSSDAEDPQYIERILSSFEGSQELESDQLPTNRAKEKASESLPPLLESLTNREVEILEMLAKRLSNKEIGDQLHIAPATVKRHAENIYSKLGVRGRRAAVAEAKSLGVFNTD